VPRSLRYVAPRTKTVCTKMRGHSSREDGFEWVARTDGGGDALQRKNAGGIEDGSWFGVRGGEFGAARFLHGRELHEFDASFVGVVEIELPFAVAADFGFFGKRGAVFAELFLCCVDVRDAERDVVHDAEKMFVLSGWVVEHEFEPVGAVRNLERDPARFVVFHAAMPVRAEAEDVFVEAFHFFAIADDEAGVNDLYASWRVSVHVGQPVNMEERNRMAFGIAHLEARIYLVSFVFVFGDSRRFYALRHEIPSHFVDIVRCDRDLLNEIALTRRSLL